MTHMLVRCVLLAAFALAPAGMSAQDRCTYNTCALWVKGGFLTRDIVRGQHGDHVAKITFLVPDLTLFAERSDSAHFHYAAFRAAKNQSFWLALAGSVLAGTALIVAGVDPNQDALVLGLGLPGLALMTGSIVRGAGSGNRLARAIWSYNSTLPR
jgi:hypothetical protein